MAKAYSTISHIKIMKYLQDNVDRLVTVSDIEDYLKAEGIAVNNSTIYRFLNKLSDSGELLKHNKSGNAMSEFQYVGSDSHDCHEHLHLHCIKCGRIIHLECSFMNDIRTHIMNHHGFTIECENSVLYGVCENCKGA